MIKTTCTTKHWAEAHGRWVHFVPRSRMVRKRAMARAAMAQALPTTPLPVDCTGGATVSSPMDGNDRLGICGPAMCDHINGIRTYGQGAPGFVEIRADLATLEAQYEKISGGDNGTDEDMLVGPSGIWTPAGGGIAGDPSATVADHLDVDVNDVALARYCHDQFYGVCMGWSVPDDFLKNFTSGSSWTQAAVANPDHGHYSPMSDVDADGNYRLWTWGAWCWVSPAFVMSVQPQCFVTFSALQFCRATGYDSRGRHVSDQAVKWIALGGSAAAVDAVVRQLPPRSAPTPTPSATATATYAQATTWMSSGINAAPDELQTKAQAIASGAAGMARGWPTS